MDVYGNSHYAVRVGSVCMELMELKYRDLKMIENRSNVKTFRFKNRFENFNTHTQNEQIERRQGFKVRNSRLSGAPAQRMLVLRSACMWTISLRVVYNLCVIAKIR